MPRITLFDRNIRPTLEKLRTETAWIEWDPQNTNKLIATQTGEVIFESENNRHTLRILNRDQDTGDITDRYNNLKELRFGNDFDLSSALWINRNGYKIAFYKQLKDIFDLSEGNINSIDIQRGNRGVVVAHNTILLSPIKYQEILLDASSISQKGNSQRGVVERYLSKLSRERFLAIEARELTSTRQGEFAFLVDRLNLSNKHRSADYAKYISEDDMKKLELLVVNLLQNDVFSPDFRRRLDDYFIRERLIDVIEIGDAILELGTSDMKTEKAKEVVALVSETPIGQLETLWQKYFEKYLLYLVYTYKKFFPKLQLDLDGMEKLPDFVGINHYDGVDVIEIKTHLKNALVYDSSHHNFAFSTEMSRAIIQVSNYMDALVQDKFARPEDRRAVATLTGEAHVHRPRAIIIISSSSRLVSRQSQYDRNQIIRDFTKLRNSLNNIEILTFDEVIGMAKRYKENIAS
jgi:hypothetical protein